MAGKPWKQNPNERDPLYSTWLGMRARCNCPTSRRYSHYGARGIRVCSRWDDFQLFAADMGPKPSPKHTIERIDNQGDYEPLNCRWATQKEQCSNKRNVRLITFDGFTGTIPDWCERLGLKYLTLYNRLQNMPLEKALTKGKMK